MNRRHFIKSMLGTGLATGSYLLGSGFGLPSARAGHTSGNPPVLVVIFQRGGCDGLNTVVPYGEADYYTLRPSISIAPPNASDPLSALAINDGARGYNNFFGLNPHMSAMLPLYQSGDLAVLPAVQYPDSSHSHFDGQDFIESAVPNVSVDGWLYRHLAAKAGFGGLQALSFGNDLANSLRGNVAVQSLTFLDDVAFPRAAGDVVDRLNNTVLPLYNATPSPASSHQRLTHATGQLMFQNFAALSNIDTANYVPANGAAYPDTKYGRRLRDTAQLIKANIGVEIVTLNIGGFDTHADQGGAEPVGAHSTRIKEFSDGVAALYSDLGSLMDNVVILSMTEFGRTAKVNGSNGTDHGDASSWFLIGKQIQGGIHGSWPGLGATQLAAGRYLRYTVDYRDVLADVLLGHLGHSASELDYLLPSHSYSRVGLFA